MKISKTLPGIVAAATAIIGLSACGSTYVSQPSGYVYVDGYYDGFHHYHYYGTPHRISVTVYNHNKSYYGMYDRKYTVTHTHTTITTHNHTNIFGKTTRHTTITKRTTVHH